MSEGTAPGSLRTERVFNAPPAAVFDAWTTVEVLRKWWHAVPSWETPFAEIDLRIGGSIQATMRNPADGREYGGGGEFTTIDRPRRLAFTWSWHDVAAADQQLIEVDFIAVDDGGTRVILTNSGLPPEEIAEYRKGWNNCFDNLAIALRG